MLNLSELGYTYCGQKDKPDPEAQIKWGPELSLLCSQAGWDTAEPGYGTLHGANLSAFLKWSNFLPWLVIWGHSPWQSLHTKTDKLRLGLNDCPCFQTLPIAASRGVLAHSSTPSPWVGVPARHPDLPWLRLGHDHFPRPFPQLARDARIRPKNSEGNRSSLAITTRNRLNTGDAQKKHPTWILGVKQLSPSMMSLWSSWLLANNMMQKLKAYLWHMLVSGTSRDSTVGQSMSPCFWLPHTRLSLYMHKTSMAPVHVCKGGSSVIYSLGMFACMQQL